MSADLWPRVFAATAGTTDWSDDDQPAPPPRQLSAGEAALTQLSSRA